MQLKLFSDGKYHQLATLVCNLEIDELQNRSALKMSTDRTILAKILKLPKPPSLAFSNGIQLTLFPCPLFLLVFQMFARRITVSEL